MRGEPCRRRGTWGPTTRRARSALAILSVSILALVSWGLAPQRGEALFDNSGYHFMIPDMTGFPGQSLTITVAGFHEKSSQGFSLAARYPSAQMTIERIHIENTILEAIDTDFFRSEVHPEGGFFTVGCLVETRPPFEANLIPNVGRPLAFFHIEAVLAEDVSEDLQVALADGLGFPPISNIYVVDNQPERVTELSGGMIRVVLGAPQFVRGDANGDAQADVSDAIAILDRQFSGRVELGCLDAADVNDDSRLDISDAVYLLSFLFLGGAEPPPPGMEPGSDPTVDTLGCLQPLF